MILQKETVWARGMQRNFVDALPELGILLRHKQSTDPPVLRRPALSAIFGAVDASGRDANVHSLLVRWVEHNRMQSQAPIARQPAGAMRMIKESTHQRPVFACVPGFEQSSRFYSAIEPVRFVGRTESNLPYIFQGRTGIGGETDRSFLRIGPAFSEIIAGAQERTPEARG